ncbi:hypothetical protein E2C01_075877 [Portunus trituberculatus]|uniref:Uncharacterized protein n=1 Tax=Portunus trituberculatus TaxID=210409 RepID=A0A5B7I9V5_PORTR|nr:hypothetical protein [Portunus trituberculatus]
MSVNQSILSLSLSLSLSFSHTHLHFLVKTRLVKSLRTNCHYKQAGGERRGRRYKRRHQSSLSSRLKLRANTSALTHEEKETCQATHSKRKK